MSDTIHTDALHVIHARAAEAVSHQYCQARLVQRMEEQSQKSFFILNP